MKFLITGSLRSTRGPRLIITLTLVGFLIFLAAHALREAGSTGFTPAAAQANLYGGPEALTALLAFEAPAGFLAILEDLHMDLFFFGLIALFLSSLLYQVRLSEATKRGWIYAAFTLPLLFVLARGAACFFAGAAYAVAPTALANYAGLTAMIAVILRDLYRPAEQQ